MMRQMRDNTKWIMLVTATAFVLLMVFQWGMDITGRTSGSLGEIGRVNGSPVQYEAYMGAYRNLYDQTQIAQTEPISTQQNRELEQAAWDQMVDGLLIRQELDRRGIDVTDEEIRQAARFQPPAEFRENPAFLTEGSFDLVKYQQFLTNSADPMLFLQLEAYYRDVLPQGSSCARWPRGYLSRTLNSGNGTATCTKPRWSASYRSTRHSAFQMIRSASRTRKWRRTGRTTRINSRCPPVPR